MRGINYKESKIEKEGKVRLGRCVFTETLWANMSPKNLCRKITGLYDFIVSFVSIASQDQSCARVSAAPFVLSEHLAETPGFRSSVTAPGLRAVESAGRKAGVPRPPSPRGLGAAAPV